MQSDNSKRIENLFRSEFSKRPEVVLRFALISLCAGLLYAHSMNALVLLWACVFAAMSASLFALTRPRISPALTLRVTASYAIYFLKTLLFASLPVYLLRQSSTVEMATGALLLAGMAIHLPQRQSPDRVTITLDLCNLLIVAALLLHAPFSQLSGIFDWIVIGVFILSIAAYYTLTAYNHVKNQNHLAETERRYARAQKIRALSQFVGGVAHEFNNQLTAIQGHLELLELSADDKGSEQAHSIAQIRAATQSASATVRQLVASSGRMRLTPRKTSVTEFLARVEHVLNNLLDEEIILIIDAPKPDLICVVDRDMLETCLIQLCLNAQDAMQKSGVITISAERFQGTRRHDPQLLTIASYVVFHVEDSGPGVCDATLRKMDEPFYTTKSQGEGQGLGLSAVAGFAKQSRGTLQLTSGQQGLRASVVLPAEHNHPSGS
jgi:signal transduction histidine kinase